MFLILPIRTDSPLKRRPIVNYALIAANVLIFVLTPEKLTLPFRLSGSHPQLYQFVTYAFLHADWTHLIGNMLFLYIFGNSLNDKLGHIEYFFFYIAGAIFSGAGYTLISSADLLGASGAIAAVTTGFLVLFPRSNILVVIWLFYFIDTFEFSSLFLIGFKMILLDNVIMPALSRTESHVAYGAHLVGYLFGFIIPLFLLAVRALDRDQFDILALWSRILRRREFAKVAEGHPFHEAGVPAELGTEMPAPIVEIRGSITEALGRFDLATAAERYRKLVEVDCDHVLARKEQLDIANQLMSQQDYKLAAEAYEKYLKHYPAAPQVEQVQLLLGIIYSRYLANPARAKDLLQQAKIRLRDLVQVNLCEEEIRRLEKP
jgi:membrane associated rhomboid family serine protease